MISKPFVGVTLRLNGNSDPVYVMGGTQSVRGDIGWTNNTTDSVYDGEMIVKFAGQALDKTSVETDGQGFYQSADNTITWDKMGVSQFTSIDPGASGSSNFSFSSLPLFTEGQPRLRNPEIDLTVTFNGTRVAAGQARTPIQTVITRKVKIATSPQIAARALYSTGPFVNSGPIPPKAEKQTTYTIVWSVSNSSNDMSDTVVEATLPLYVKWLNVYAPQSENMSFDADSGTVKWDIGALKAGTGITSSAREVSFQVAMVPSVAQVNTMPLLTSDAVIQGTDDFTGTTVKGTRRGVTTFLSSDPSYKQNDGLVGQ
jgi:hypothetical protein